MGKRTAISILFCATPEPITYTKGDQTPVARQQRLLFPSLVPIYITTVSPNAILCPPFQKIALSMISCSMYSTSWQCILLRFPCLMYSWRAVTIPPFNLGAAGGGSGERVCGIWCKTVILLPRSPNTHSE